MNKYQKMNSQEKWEAKKTEEVFSVLETSDKGLDAQEATLRLNEFGENKLPEPPKKSNLVLFLSQFNNALIYVLLVSSVITAFMQHWLDTGVILGVVIINSIIGYIQEGKAEKALDSIRHMLAPHATVIREGQKNDIDAKYLVPGDLIYLKAGDRVPADIRITGSNNLRVEEASFTGEAEEVLKSPDPVRENTELADRTSMTYMGTTVRNGSATGIVVSTGVNTELGKINTMMTDTKETTTPLIKKINKLGIFLSFVIVGFSLLIFLYGYFIQDMNAAEIFLTVIGIAVAAIPEGLPAILTITLAIGVQKMARRNAIVRRLPSVETLGSVTVICSDKTGTLTKNEMTVVSVYTAQNDYKVEGIGYTPEGSIIPTMDTESKTGDHAFDKLIEAAWLCNDAEIANGKSGWEVIGAPTEGAIKVLAMKAGVEQKSWETQRVYAIPFDSQYKYMATINSIDEERFVFVVGAPERILALCGNGDNQEGIKTLQKADWEKRIESGASQGQRMLGAAYFKADNTKTELNHEELRGRLVFLGVYGIIDPPREEAIRAVRSCSEAGITVKMITGDHVLTAMSIGKQMGIGDGETSYVGADLEKMSDEELRIAVKACHIFARTSPEHKLRIVRAIQENGEICAMTGDGVNDAPALKKADMGIAMGVKGTEVTKEASDLILADDNFASIVHAVEEGRTIYDNIRKTLLFILPTNGAEALSILIALFAGLAMPITAPQILWINMITAVTLGISLSFEPMENNTMKRPPKNPKDSILGKYFNFRILYVSALAGVITLFSFIYWTSNGATNEYASTVAVNTLVLCEMFYLYNCKKIYEPAIGHGFFKNRIVLMVTGVLILFQLVFTYVPFLNMLFQTEQLDAKGWIAPVIGGVIILIVVEIDKFIARRVIKK